MLRPLERPVRCRYVWLCLDLADVLREKARQLIAVVPGLARSWRVVGTLDKRFDQSLEVLDVLVGRLAALLVL
jgi:hypothetical protein